MSTLWGDMPLHGRALAALLLAAFLAAPLIADRYLVSVLILVLYFAYVGQAWNLLMGFAGQLSLGHALYLGLGAYTAAAIWIHFGVGPWLGVLAAIPIAALGGAFIGWLGWRFSIEGVYFALLTIAFAEFTRIGFDHWDFTGASAGLFLPIGGEAAAQWWNLGGGPLLFYYIALALATGAAVFTAVLRRSPLGYRWLAVREDAEAARALGINIFRTRMTAMLISSSMTAVAGVFYAFYYRNLFPAQVFDISRSIELILAPIIGGLGTVFGPIVGALILTPLGEALIAATERLGLNAPGTKAVFYGLTLMVIIWLRPNGVWPWLAAVLGLRSKRQ
jgi:branched-chain amino acid transport system permease protein